MSFRELTLRKDPECPLCGERPRITELQDYEEFCGVAPGRPDEAAGTESREIGVREAAALRERSPEIVLLDVREPHEHAIARIDGAVLIPLRSLPERMNELDRSRTIVVHCHHGVRSARAVELLRGAGFADSLSMRGGIDAWSQEIDSLVPRY
jgi:adenylyltransferase/sulfurtransferase